jgi:creatinine amidohydrolase/Fe(II)-dependent formamide hydrolase-like protein
MAFTGTISVSEFVFKSILLNTVFSLSQHGFKKFYFLGDSGSNQTGQHNAATFLQSQGYNAHHIPAYYANDVQNDYLIKKYGFTLQQIGTHIGIRDTSELLYASPESVRSDKIVNNEDSDFNKTGGNGNAYLATAKIGKALLNIKINRAITAIQQIEGTIKSEKP